MHGKVAPFAHRWHKGYKGRNRHEWCQPPQLHPDRIAGRQHPLIACPVMGVIIHEYLGNGVGAEDGVAFVLRIEALHHEIHAHAFAECALKRLEAVEQGKC